MSPNRSFTLWVPIAAFALLLGSALEVLGQGHTPDRGFQAGSSYALSDIESISTTNGNMMLHFPFKLPPGRGGASAELSLHYESKIYDSSLLITADSPARTLEILRATDHGSWHYGTGYQVELHDRRFEDSSYSPNCPAQDLLAFWKLKVVFPDGSEHEMIPYGYNDHQDGHGWYDIRPDGTRSVWVACSNDGSGNGSTANVPYVTNSDLNYYSTDGTNLRLDTQNGGGLGSWTLYFADGSRVSNQNGSGNTTAAQYIYGRNGNNINGNYVTLDNITYNGQPATRLRDPLGRQVILEYGSSSSGTTQDTVLMNGVGGESLTYLINWKTVNLNKNYDADELPIIQYPTPAQSLFVVSSIVLPSQTGGLSYTFGYNAPDSPDTTTPASGWGEINSVLLPSGAHVQYHHNLDGTALPRWDDVIRNTITQKSVTYLQEYDCSPNCASTVTDTWSYSIQDSGGTTSTTTNPDGGIQTEYHDNYRHTYKTQEPDGTVVERIWKPNNPQGQPIMYDSIGTYTNASPGTNTYLKTEFTSIPNAAHTALVSTAIKNYSYDKNNNVTSVTEYDWVDYGSVTRDGNGNPTGVIPANAVVKRVTNNTYWRPTPDASDSTSNNANSYWLSSSPNLRTAVASTEVGNGSQPLSRAEFYYDDPAGTGNLTQQTSWDSTKGGYSSPLNAGNSISVFTQYNQYGSPTLSTDARGYHTLTTYGSVGGFVDLYPTEIQTAYQTSVQRAETYVPDFWTGVVTSATDADNNVTTATTYDVFGRPRLVKSASGQPEESDTSTEYSDISRYVIVRSDLNTVGDGRLVTIHHYDQLGRIRLSRQLEDSTTQALTTKPRASKSRHAICTAAPTPTRCRPIPIAPPLLAWRLMKRRWAGRGQKTTMVAARSKCRPLPGVVCPALGERTLPPLAR